MAVSIIDEQPLSAVVLEETIPNATATLRRRLLAEIMPSVLHELSRRARSKD